MGDLDREGGGGGGGCRAPCIICDEQSSSGRSLMEGQSVGRPPNEEAPTTDDEAETERRTMAG